MAKFSKRPLLDALEAVRDVRSTWEQTEAAKATLTVPDPYLDGQKAVDEWRARLERLEREAQAASAAAVEAVHRARAAWDDELTRAFVPCGADTMDPDFRLLELELVGTPDELRRVLDRHGDSIVFQRQGERYAAARHWEGFSETWNGAALESFAADVFGLMETAAAAPSGYWAMVFAQPEPLDDMAAGAGIADEWSNAGDE